MSDERDSDQHSDPASPQMDNVADMQFTTRWGLWPTLAGGRQPAWHELLHYWFVQYNPLFFFSALCVLGGVYLLTLELDSNTLAGADYDWALGQVLLFAVIQIYEFLLIAAAGFLVHKAGLIRPAVILTLLEAVFLLDCTFRLETLSHMGFMGMALSVAWVALVPAKALLLGRALGVAIPPIVIGLVAGSGAGLALMLQTLSMADVNRPMVILMATWWGAALIAGAVIAKPRFIWSGARGDTHPNVLNRVAKSILIVLGGIYFYHVLNYVAWIGVEDGRVFDPMIGTAFLMVALLRASEKEIWIGIFLSLLFGLNYPPAAVPMCALSTAVLLYRTWRLGNARLAVGAVLSAYLATWTIGWTGGTFPSPPMWSAIVAGSLLGFMAWRLREPTAALVLALGILLSAGRYGFNPMLLLPQTRLGLGIMLVAAGFLTLTAGVWISWWFRSPAQPVTNCDDGPDAPHDSRITEA